MNPRRRTTATALAGAVVLASAAYAIGSQSDSGTSGAATGAAARNARFGDRFESLASRLGVSEAELRAALEDVRKSNPPPAGDPRARFEKALADALGMDQSKVADALDQLRSQHEAEAKARREQFAKSLAAELGLDADKVSTALEKLRPQRRLRHAGRLRILGPPPGGDVERAPAPPPGAPRAGFALPAPGPPHGGEMRGRRVFRLGPPPGHARFVTRLAAELGVERSKLRGALQKLRPDGPKGGLRGGPRGGLRAGGPPAAFVDDLAKALGADSADVRAALEKVRSQLQSAMKARRDKLAAALADRLNLPVEKVKDALAAGPFGPPNGPPPGGPADGPPEGPADGHPGGPAEVSPGGPPADGPPGPPPGP